VARSCEPNGVVGFGGGSPIDVAKLLAALWNKEQTPSDVFGIGLLKGRSTYLACIPTTAGTGADVSPNSILLDESDLLKKGVVSPYLVADASFVDPELTLGLPPSITAATGYDALVHCMEAYANVHAHPIVDVIALEGIRRIGLNLEKAVSDGSDLNARTEVMLGALYGGLCLGPVNTAAVHALAYPLGGAFHVAHGVSNSLLTPHVFRFNLPAAVDRYADIARMLGVERGLSDEATGQRGVERLTELSINCGIPQHLRDFDVPEEALSVMARDSMKVTRLLQNNPRPVTEEDALEIYRSAW
jgi:alcohol dehydrogenase class IV